MFYKKNRVISIILLVFSIIVITLFLYGYIEKPKLTYRLSTIIDYNETYDFSINNLPVFLYVKNIGDSSIDVNIIVRLYNSSIIGYNYIDYDFYKELSINLVEGLKPEEEANVTVYLTFESGHEYIAMQFIPEPIRDFNPINSFSESFATLISNRPTAILMRHVNGTIFTRVSNR